MDDFNLSAKEMLAMPIEVLPEDLDMNKHVNNEVYLKWVMQAATAHSQHVGYPFEIYRQIGSIFVVRRHEIDYIAPARLGDKLMMLTYSEPMSGCRGIRRYLLRRDPDFKTILEAKTLWTFVDMNSGRPKPIPKAVIAAFAGEDVTEKDFEL